MPAPMPAMGLRQLPDGSGARGGVWHTFVCFGCALLVPFSRCMAHHSMPSWYHLSWHATCCPIHPAPELTSRVFPRRSREDRLLHKRRRAHRAASSYCEWPVRPGGIGSVLEGVFQTVLARGHRPVAWRCVTSSRQDRVCMRVGLTVWDPRFKCCVGYGRGLPSRGGECPPRRYTARAASGEGSRPAG